MSTRPRRSRPQRCDGNSLAVAAQLVEKNHYYQCELRGPVSLPAPRGVFASFDILHSG